MSPGGQLGWHMNVEKAAYCQLHQIIPGQLLLISKSIMSRVNRVVHDTSTNTLNLFLVDSSEYVLFACERVAP